MEPCRAAPAACCLLDVAPKIIVVRIDGGIPVAVIDAPANGHAFCEAVMKQVNIVKAKAAAGKGRFAHMDQR